MAFSRFSGPDGKQNQGERGRRVQSDFLRSEKGIQDKCGVFGVWGAPQASRLAYFASHMQQHRGQAGAGIVTVAAHSGIFSSKHGYGIVNEIFDKNSLDELEGHAAIAHVRYPTQGPAILANLQPLISVHERKMAIAHNGEFSNYKAVKLRLESEGVRFSTTSDTEIALHKLMRSGAATIEGRVAEAFADLQPSYAITILTRNELVGIRDPYGIRPLVIGQLNNGSFALASETVAFDGIGARYIGEVERGEAVFIDDKGMRRIQVFEPKRKIPCIFEYIYFGRPESRQFGSRYSNAEIRMGFGRQLYREHPVKADMVIPVPDSSVDCAIGLSEESGIPLRFGLVRSHYIGRTFIEPTQDLRDAMILRKYNVNTNLVEGKKLVVVDDSIVRGSIVKIIKLLRARGAKEVHVRISSPPYTNGCHLGIDTAETAKLVAYRFGSVERIREYINADSLGYLSKEGLLSNPYLPSGGWCTYCFDGREMTRGIG